MNDPRQFPVFPVLALGIGFFLASIFSRAAAETKAVPSRLKIGVVQMALAADITGNRDRIVSGIANAAERSVRVVVFPEGALQGRGNEQPARVDEAIEAIRRAARSRNVYVLFGGTSHSPRAGKVVNWMSVIGPDGQDVFGYDKLYDQHDGKMPGVFQIDGVRCAALICADRWLRGVEEIPIQQGAQVSFELSSNYANEWVAPFGWYWYVSRALRNNVWVIFANTGNTVSGVPDGPAGAGELRHGHSAIIAPDGRIVAAAHDDVESIVVAEVDVCQATRAEALARASHPVLRAFWEAGSTLQSGQTVEVPPVTALTSSETEITLAVAQVTEDVAGIEAMIGQAAAKHADLVVFPERAIAESVLDRVQTAARDSGITIVVGAEHLVESGRRNSAFVVGPDGSVLTRYDQLSATSPFQAGTDPQAMWFRVKGVPAVVTIGRDALWTELAELAAVAGAQIHVHLDREPASDANAKLKRLQIGVNLAAFHTFTAVANVVGSAIWDDLRNSDERRAEVRDLLPRDGGGVEVYSPFSANLVVRAGEVPQLITATRRVSRLNPHHPGCTSHMNPQMDAWYRFGARLIAPPELKSP